METVQQTMKKYQGKYRIESTRLKNWDYAAAGYYFVTICTRHRQPFFGRVQGGVMRLSPVGEIARRCWVEIPHHFDHAAIDEFVVMPNHVHGLVVLYDNTVETRPAETRPAETRHVASLPEPREFGPLKPGSLSKIVQAYKAAVTRLARMEGFRDFAWQPRFYDHIVRDRRALQNIRRYIRENPQKWELDRYYSQRP